MRTATAVGVAAVPRMPRLRASILFGALLGLLALLVARALYLQWIDNGFLQEQGSSR